MPAIGKRDMVKERHWRAVVKDWQRSGLSGPEYCRKHDLKYHSLNDWRRAIRARDEEAKVQRQPKKVSGVASVDTSGNDRDFPEFLPVQVVDLEPRGMVVDKAAIDPEFVMEVVLSNCVLRLKDTCSIGFLSSVVAVVQ